MINMKLIIFSVIILSITKCGHKNPQYFDYNFISLQPITDSVKSKSVLIYNQGNETFVESSKISFAIKMVKRSNGFNIYTGSLFTHIEGDYDNDIDTIVEYNNKIICQKKMYLKNNLVSHALILWRTIGDSIICEMGTIDSEIDNEESIFSKAPNFYFDFMSKVRNIKTKKIFIVKNDKIVCTELIKNSNNEFYQIFSAEFESDKDIGTYLQILYIYSKLSL
jgi:hypothetical protein